MKRVTIDIDEEFDIALRRRTMSDKLVYVDSVKKRLNEAYGEGNLLGLDGILSDVPTVDAVEVVRCSNCKHFTEGKAIGKCYLNPCKPIIPVPYKHFCSYGERRDENAVD